MPNSFTLGLPRWLSGQESACQCRRLQRLAFDPWVGKIPWRREWQPTPVFLPGKSDGQRSLAVYSPWGCKELGTTERLNLLTCVRLFATPWTVAHQAPLSMKFSRQEYWSGLPYPPPGDLPDPGIEPSSPAWQVDSLPRSRLRSLKLWYNITTRILTEI